MLPAMGLSEPLVTAMVTLLQTNLPAVIDEMNATITDGYLVDQCVQILPFVPVPSALEGGMPAIGVQDLPVEFVDDLQFDTDAVHTYAVVVVLQNADHQTLTWQLRRTIQAIAYTIQADRAVGTSGGTGGIMRDQGGAYSVEFIRTEPGPLLGDVDPINPDTPPRSYASYTALVLQSRRNEVG